MIAPVTDASLFALITEGERWWAEIGIYAARCDCVVARQEGREVAPDDQANLDEAHASYRGCFERMLASTPHAAAGMRAQLEWVTRECDGSLLPHEHLRALLGSLLASPILSAEDGAR